MTTTTMPTGTPYADVRPVRTGTARRRLRVVGGSGRLHWWHGRLTLGLTLAGAMVGALYGVVQAVLDGRWVPVEALESYGAGAGFGASIGLLLGLAVGLLLGLIDRWVLPQVTTARPLWVLHRR